ncbi:hypothetical protein WJX74_000352 [Apatococcus lobatus]|uniref:Uncharacterized protein n=1 Tax=Apatococcus lobatus TaxID=904363 RepID=A0AAW1RY02_9CHLO
MLSVLDCAFLQAEQCRASTFTLCLQARAYASKAQATARHCAHRKKPVQASAQAGSALKTSELGLVLSPSAEGWDSASLGNPVVRCFAGQVGEEGQQWKLWYSGSEHPASQLDAVAPAAGSVGLAVSGDGITWRRDEGRAIRPGESAPALPPGVALGPNQDNWWWHDTMALSVSDVQIFASGDGQDSAGVYWMYYSGSNFEEAEMPQGLAGSQSQSAAEGLRLRPGLAMSQDGRNWARIEGEHHTGALFEVGKAGEWDEAFIAGPQVVAAGPNDMRMFYHSFDQQQQRCTVGLATSKDGFRWRKQGSIFSGSLEPGAFDSRGVTSRHVIRDPDSNRWLMFYEGIGDDGTSAIGLAVSDSGRDNWRRCPDPILTAASDEDAWDAGCVGAPCAVAMAYGKWRLYYAGRQQKGPGNWQGIGLALTSDAESVREFEGIRLSYQRRQTST